MKGKSKPCIPKKISVRSLERRLITAEPGERERRVSSRARLFLDQINQMWLV